MKEKKLIKNKPKATRKRIKSMALDVATRTYYDSDDHKQGKTPVTEYSEVEKAIKKGLEEIGIEIKED